MTLGQTLKQLRNKQGLSQGDIANEFGWGNGQYVSNFESGKSFPPIHALPKLSQLYKVDVKWLKVTVLEAMIADYKEELKEKMGL